MMYSISPHYERDNMENYFKTQRKVFNIIDFETCSHSWKYFLTEKFTLTSNIYYLFSRNKHLGLYAYLQSQVITSP